jgi:hypothetical protein
MESFQDWRRAKRYGWQGGTRVWQTLGMAEQYNKEVVEPVILSGDPVKKVREGLVDLYHDYKDDRIIDLLKLIESINNGG